jgi:tetratricopeptide (TPR) repeat protein
MEESRVLEPVDKEEMKPAGFALGWIKVRLVLLFPLFLLAASCALPRIIVLHDPLSPEEHINLGLAYEKKGETENAIREYQQASKELPAAYVYLGNICFSKGAYVEAEGYYRKAIKKKPDLADAYNNLAWLLYTRGGNIREALGKAKEAVKLNPSNAQYTDTLNKIEEALAKQERSTPAP